MINIHIGSNDMCGACNSTYMDEVTSNKFGGYVEVAIDRIHNSIPKALANLIGTFNIAEVFLPTAANKRHCIQRLDGIDGNGCSGASTPEGLEKMNQLNICKDIIIPSPTY